MADIGITVIAMSMFWGSLIEFQNIQADYSDRCVCNQMNDVDHAMRFRTGHFSAGISGNRIELSA